MEPIQDSPKKRGRTERKTLGVADVRCPTCGGPAKETFYSDYPDTMNSVVRYDARDK
jgi:hypothetical protein